MRFKIAPFYCASNHAAPLQPQAVQAETPKSGKSSPAQSTANLKVQDAFIPWADVTEPAPALQSGCKPEEGC